MSTRALSLRMVSIYALKLILIVLLSVSWLIVDAHPVHACSCGRTDPAEALNRSEAVFSGNFVAPKILYKSVGRSPSLSNSYHLQALIQGMPESNVKTVVYEFKVDSIWKGPAYEYVFLQTSGHCGAEFIQGNQYLVFARGDMHVDFCSSIPLHFAKDDLKSLGEGEAPARGTRAPELAIMRGLLSGQEMIQELKFLLDEVQAELDFKPSPPPTEPPIRAQGASTNPSPYLQMVTIQRLAKALYQLQEERVARLRTPTPIPTAVPTPTPMPAALTPQPTLTSASTPATLAAATTFPRTPIPAPEAAANIEEARAPGWLIPAIAGAGGVLVAVLGATLTLRRRHGGR